MNTQENQPFGTQEEQTANCPKRNVNKIAIGIAIAAVAIALIIVLAIVLIPTITVSTKDLLAEGNYIEAYEKADVSEKDDILAENVIAVLSQITSDTLKDPTSFLLREGYYYPFITENGDVGGNAILYISAANSYGAKVSGYYMYILSDQEWEYFGAVEVSYYEDGDSFYDMMIKDRIQNAMTNGIQLSKEQVHRINNLFENDLLYAVEAIDWGNVDMSNFKNYQED